MTAAALAPATDTVAPSRRLVIFAGLLLVMLLSALDSTIVATALPTIVRELGGLERLSWVVTAYLLAQTVVTPLYGKLGDQYGRKRVLQVAIVLFLVGSALCGASRDMLQLILFRAIQGIGGGGLVVGTQAAIGDVVPPRERGRYQGIFGAVFGISSIAGPLLGGFFTTHLSWRWIFYVNLPLGVAALIVLAATLPSTTKRAAHRVDYAGAALLAFALAACVLVSDLGGARYAWASPQVLALGAAGLIALVAFIAVERRAAEPVLPPRLFRNKVFVVSSVVGLIVGFAMFGSITYLPLYLQTARGASPTGSGLQLLPMMAGMLTASITSGQIISRTGKYRFFPIAGTLVMTCGLAMLSRLHVETSMLVASLDMLVLGLGMGMTMQVLVLAVQNAVDYEDLGVATSGATLFRSIGGSVGTAILGAIFSARLVPATAPRAEYLASFTHALGTVFIVAASVAVIGFLLTWLLEERPLRETVAATATTTAEEIAMPMTDDALDHVARGIAAIASRDVKKRLIERVAARAGVDLPAAEVWLLARLREDPTLDVDALGRSRQIPTERLATALDILETRGLVTPGATHAVTPAGATILERLVAARQTALRELLACWAPDRHADLSDFIRRVATDDIAMATPA